jgi:hypothetical protein
LEAEGSAELVERRVDLVEGGVDGVLLQRWPSRAGLNSECRERAEKTHSELDEEDAELGTLRSEPIATRAAEALHQAFGAEFGQVVAQLAEAVISLGQPIPGQDAFVEFASGPIRGKRTRMQQRLQQADDEGITNRGRSPGPV